METLDSVVVAMHTGAISSDSGPWGIISNVKFQPLRRCALRYIRFGYLMPTEISSCAAYSNACYWLLVTGSTITSHYAYSTAKEEDKFLTRSRDNQPQQLIIGSLGSLTIDTRAGSLGSRGGLGEKPRTKSSCTLSAGSWKMEVQFRMLRMDLLKMGPPPYLSTIVHPRAQPVQN